MSRFAYRLSRFHKLLGIVIGIQFFFWTISGFFFTLYPIEVVRGDHLRKQAFPDELALAGMTLVPLADLAIVTDGNVERLTLKPSLDGPVYEVVNEGKTDLFDARTGEKISPLSKDAARRLAVASWGGDSEFERIVLLEKGPRESGLSGAAWRADFAGRQSGTLYINPQNGEVRSVRTGIWRIFDFFWGIHIMDWVGRENFSTWWLKVFSFGAITMTLLGFGILIDRARKGRLLK